MKALILVGGYGTRLRPLTFSVPKPVVEFANKPIVGHQIEALVKVGVKEVVLAISYQPQMMMDYIKKAEAEFGIKITCSLETEPLGTAGPLKLAQEILTKDNDEGLFFVFNSDVICEFPLQELINFHKGHGKEGSILLTQVEDPSKYGVVLYDDKGKINQFVEKPKDFIGDKINAGLYLFNTSILKRIQPKPTSIEREIFPQMASEGELYAQVLKGFWMDIGQPKDFLTGTSLYLNYLRKQNSKELATGKNIVGDVLIHPTAQVHEDALIGPNVTIGPGVKIERGVRLQRTAVFNDVVVKDYSWIADSIIGWNSIVGRWVRIEGLTVLAEDVNVKDEVFINASFILPHKSVTASITEKGTIVM